jgi:hypothetical protein
MCGVIGCLVVLRCNDLCDLCDSFPLTRSAHVSEKKENV